MTIQDSASVNVGGELDVNYYNTGEGPSTLTLQAGSLTVSGSTVIGRAAMRTDPSNTNAAFYQNGGTANLGTTSGGPVVVGLYGTATSLYDISGGTLNANYGIQVGSQGNGELNIDGGVANVKGPAGEGLVVGEDASLATAGFVNLASGSLSVSGGMSLGGGGGVGTFSRSGGTLSVSGGLLVGGTATLILDDTYGSVATAVTGTLTRKSGTLVIVPQNGDLGSTEGLSFTQAPALTNGILGAFAVAQASGYDSTGDYLTTTGTGPYSLTTATYFNGLAGATGTTVASVTGSSSLGQNTSVYAIKFADSTTTTLGSYTLSVSSGGMILNGGTLSGGTVAFGSAPLIYVGSNDPGAISSALNASSGLVKFGPGTLVLSGSNTGLSGNIYVNSGAINIQNAWALGASGTGNNTMVAAGASLQIQGNTAVGGNAITLNGTGLNGNGAIQNVQDNNSFAGVITLNSNTLINTTSGTLTLSGPIQGSYDLTTSGSGTLVLAGANTLFGAVNIAEGTVTATNSGALGLVGGIGATVNAGATLQLQGGIAVPSVSLTLNGAGTSGNGALENIQGSNSFAGPITLGSDSQVNVDNAADTLTLSNTISGGCALTMSGAGTLLLSGNNSFTGGLTVASGSLSVASLNNAGAAGPLGARAVPVVLGGSTTATLLYTGSGTTSNQAFMLAAGAGVFAVNSSLGLSGVISGSGNLTKAGSGILTLSGSNLYTGTTTVGSGTLAISGSAASINGTSGIAVSQGCLLQVSGGSGGQLPGSGSITLDGGNLNYLANVSAGTAGEVTGALSLNPGQSSVTTGNAGSGVSYLRFSGAPSAVIGATVNFAVSSTNASIQFLTNPPGSSIIGGYAYYTNGSNIDFATLTATNAAYTVGAITSSTTGDLGTFTTSGTTNAKPGVQSSFSTAKEINSLNLMGTAGVTMTGSGSLKLDSGGLIANTTGSITGGTLKGSSGSELTINTVQNLTIGSAITDNGGSTALVKTGSGTLTLTGSDTFTGNIYLNQGTLVDAPSNNQTYAGVISGIGSFTKSGSGELTLTGSNTYGGGTVVSAGTLQAGSATALGSGGSLTIGSQGTMDLDGHSYSFSSLSGSTGGVLTDSSTTAGTTAVTVLGSGSENYGGNISNGSSRTLALVVSGSGSLTLSGTDTYTGGTTISGGTLDITSAAALPSSGLITIGGGGRLVLGGGSGIGALLAASAPIESGEGISLGAASQSQATVSLGDVGGASETPQNTSGGAASWPQADPGGGGGANAVPEPGTLSLALAAIIGLGLILRRRGTR